MPGVLMGGDTGKGASELEHGQGDSASGARAQLALAGGDGVQGKRTTQKSADGSKGAKFGCRMVASAGMPITSKTHPG